MRVLRGPHLGRLIKRVRGCASVDEVTPPHVDGLERGLTIYGEAIFQAFTEADRVRNAHFQISQANETFRFLTGLAAVTFSFLTAAAVALLVVAAELSSRELILGSATCMLACAGLWIAIVRQLITLAVVAMRAERSVHEGEFGVVQFFAKRHGRKLGPTLQRLSDLNQEEAVTQLRRWSTGFPFGAGIFLLIMLVALALIAFSFTQPWAWVDFPRLERLWADGY